VNARKSAREGRGGLAQPALLVVALLCAVVACGGGDTPADSIAPPDEAAPVDTAADIEAQIRALEALGYAGVSPADDPEAPTGVVLHDRERAEPGLNLLTSGHGPEALLCDMEGRVVHAWRKGFEEVWPER
jgi:hypothetical protein